MPNMQRHSLQEAHVFFSMSYLQFHCEAHHSEALIGGALRWAGRKRHLLGTQKRRGSFWQYSSLYTA